MMDKAIKKRIEQIARGEAPEGYEKTAFGIFPCDWVKDSPLGSLFDFYGGLGKSRDELGEDGEILEPGAVSAQHSPAVLFNVLGQGQTRV